MIRLLDFISFLIGLYMWVIIAGAVMSWLIAFNVINPYNPFVRSLVAGAQCLDGAGCCGRSAACCRTSAASTSRP